MKIMPLPVLSLGPVMKKSWNVRSINHKLKRFGEYCFQVREGLEANVQIRGPGSSCKILLIAAIIKYY